MPITIYATGQRPDYEPTRAEIHAACAVIQESWSKQEERRRRGLRCSDKEFNLEFPVLRDGLLLAALDGRSYRGRTV